MTVNLLMVRSTRRRLSRELLAGLLAFVAIGSSGAGAFVVLSTVMIWLNPSVPAWIVSACCYGATILPVYLLHRRFSFHSDASHLHALPRYVAVQCLALALTAVFSFVAHGHLALPTAFASILVVGLTSGVNFVVLRSWAFARRRAPAQAAAATGFQ